MSMTEGTQPPAPKPSDMFRRMADRMDLNAKDGFGGAFVIVPPEGGGGTLETLILDTKLDPTQFWILLKSKCDDELSTLGQKQRMDQGFGGRR